jgi:hypothetical protein
MQGGSKASEGDSSSTSSHDLSTLQVTLATACLVWYLAVIIACTIGYVQLYSFPWFLQGSLANIPQAEDITLLRHVHLSPRGCLSQTSLTSPFSDLSKVLSQISTNV